jgi:hypothetical protein
MDGAKIEAARRLLDTGMPANDVAATLAVSISTFYRHRVAGPAALTPGAGGTDPASGSVLMASTLPHRITCANLTTPSGVSASAAHLDTCSFFQPAPLRTRFLRQSLSVSLGRSA